jgi:enoyl-CoA hydratase/carnithine racemase
MSYNEMELDPEAVARARRLLGNGGPRRLGAPKIARPKDDEGAGDPGWVALPEEAVSAAVLALRSGPDNILEADRKYESRKFALDRLMAQHEGQDLSRDSSQEGEKYRALAAEVMFLKTRAEFEHNKFEAAKLLIELHLSST